MTKYRIMVLNRKFETHDCGTSLLEARIKACRYTKKEGKDVMISKLDVGKGFGRWLEMERVWYDPEPNKPGSYTAWYPGFWINIYDGKRYKKSRVSPKTGRLLDVSKEWKSI